MINIFHGDNQSASRLALPQGRRFLAKNLPPEKRQQILTGEAMFTQAEPIIIEGLIDLPATDKEVYIWVGKKLSAAQLKHFPGAKVTEFKLPPVLWQFLKSLKLKDLAATLKTQPVELVWFLLHRQASRQQNSAMLKKMFAIELDVKSGKSDVPLRTQLELLI